MKKVLILSIVLCALSSGCDSLRFAPGELQKQNAWLHDRTTAVAADAARSEGASRELQALTRLSNLQSRAFTSYYGLPKQFPKADTSEEILAESNVRIAEQALDESAERPDAWEMADSALELGIGICALLGGVYGTRAVGFLRDARAKSKALQEIISGNELFKNQNSEQAPAFKQAHQGQSPQTRRIVTQIKSST